MELLGKAAKHTAGSSDARRVKRASDIGERGKHDGLRGTNAKRRVFPSDGRAPDVTALHNRLFYDDPNVFFMHTGGEAEACVNSAAIHHPP